MKIRLTYSALDDLDLLLMNEAERSGWTRSMDVEAQLWHHFEELSRTPALGHLRQDITQAVVHFYYSDPYMIVYRQEEFAITIVAVIHGARDLTAVLKNRTEE